MTAVFDRKPWLYVHSNGQEVRAAAAETDPRWGTGGWEYKPREFRYEVFTVMRGTGNHIYVYRGDNRDEAVRVCNFWDEKQDTYFNDVRQSGAQPSTPLEIAMTKFDVAIDMLLHAR